MPRPRKVKRNKEIVRMRDEGGLSFRKIAQEKGMGTTTVFDVYYREKARDPKDNERYQEIKNLDKAFV